MTTRLPVSIKAFEMTWVTAGRPAMAWFLPALLSMMMASKSASDRTAED